MRRSLFVCHYPVFGGPHSQILQLAEPLRRRGWESVVLLPEDADEAARRLADAGLEVLTAPLRRLRATKDPRPNLSLAVRFAQDVRRVQEVARREHVSIVVNSGLLNPHAAVAGRASGLGVVWQLIDISAPSPVRRALGPLVARIAHVVMTDGVTTARQHPGIQSLGPRLIPFFVPVDAHRFKRDARLREEARAELGLDAHEPVVGMVANLGREKDHFTFVRAASSLRRLHPDVRFVMLGATYPHRASANRALWELAEALGVPVGDVIVHRDAGAAVARLENAFDVFWLTSRTEAVATAIAEAMSMELPVVATHVGGVHEAVEDGVTGFLVPPGDAEAFAETTARLLGDPDLRRRLGEAGRRRAIRQHDVEDCADVSARAYELAARLARRRRAGRRRAATT